MEIIQSTEESEDGSHSVDAFASVVGPEHPGRVRLYGRGVTKTVLKGQKGNLGSSSDATDERMQQKMEEMEEGIQQRMHEKLNEQKDAMEQNITMNVISRLQRLNPDLRLDPDMLRFSARSPVKASSTQQVVVQVNSRPSAGSNNQGQVIFEVGLETIIFSEMGSNFNFKKFGNEPPGEGGSGVAGKQPGNFQLPRQPSIYSLTFDEFLSTTGGSGKDFGSMNMDELLKNIWNAEESQIMGGSGINGQEVGSLQGGNLQRQGSLTLPRTLSHKTVDEVWRDMSKEYGGSFPSSCRRESQLRYLRIPITKTAEEFSFISVLKAISKHFQMNCVVNYIKSQLRILYLVDSLLDVYLQSAPQDKNVDSCLAGHLKIQIVDVSCRFCGVDQEMDDEDDEELDLT
ncbi:abscisic acid-insensitive 5-like protein 5 [Nicotiana attenuata]|uniref:Abscisic acid-insensitive 5-like protein 5 n=1 Tax=Nicotiana attenuata TaxID=49451 RepID=A0A1J6JDB2_NICAT|nr:abscisic acid-insensitive 5-like protein 5 [Nicotiana attenuata]